VLASNNWFFFSFSNFMDLVVLSLYFKMVVIKQKNETKNSIYRLSSLLILKIFPLAAI